MTLNDLDAQSETIEKIPETVLADGRLEVHEIVDQ